MPWTSKQFFVGRRNKRWCILNNNKQKMSETTRYHVHQRRTGAKQNYRGAHETNPGANIEKRHQRRKAVPRANKTIQGANSHSPAAPLPLTNSVPWDAAVAAAVEPPGVRPLVALPCTTVPAVVRTGVIVTPRTRADSNSGVLGLVLDVREPIRPQGQSRMPCLVIFVPVWKSVDLLAGLAQVGRHYQGAIM